MRKTILFTIIFACIILFTTKVNAAGSVNLSSNKSKVIPGEEFTITTNLSGVNLASYTVRVNVDTTKVDYVSGTTGTSFSAGRAIYTWTDPAGGASPKTGGELASFTFRAKTTGTATFSLTGDFIDPDLNNANPSLGGISVTIEQPTPPVQEPTSPPSGQTGEGSTSGPIGGNIPSGGTSTPSGNTNNTSSSTASNNANLKSLQLDKEGLTPKFNAKTTTYSIVIGNDINTINVTAVPENPSSKVSISENNNLKEGLNKIEVVVTAPDNKTKKTYTINVTKTANPELANANLENLAIEFVTMEPEFDTNVTDYTGKVGSTVDKLNILAVAQRPDAKIEIINPEELQFGENIVTVKVIAEDGITEKLYTINVYKMTEEEEAAENSLDEDIDIQEGIDVDMIVRVGSGILILGSCGAIAYLLIKRYKK